MRETAPVDNDLPRVADLLSLVGSLRNHPEHKKMMKLASQAQRAQSCVADLTLAQTSCETLSQIDSCDLSALPPLHRSSLQHSLVVNAVVLYARATSTHSAGGERGSVSIDDRLSEADLADHRVLVDLRNKVIAHVHSEREIAESIWHREKMILREVGPAWLPGCATRRVQVEPATVARLRKLIPVARALVRDTFIGRLGSLADALNRNPVEQSEIERHLFDAAAFFGSIRAARDALSPGPGDSAAGLAE